MKDGMCKEHFYGKIRTILAKEFRDLYRSPEAAYAALDFNGKGYICKDDILGSIAVKRHLVRSFTDEDLNSFLFYNLLSSWFITSVGGGWLEYIDLYIYIRIIAKTSLKM